MDGMLTKVVGEVRTDEGPRPFVTSEAMVTQALGAEVRSPLQRLLDAERQAKRRELLSDRLVALRDGRRITAAEARAGSEIRMVCEWQAGAMQPVARSQFRERLAASAYDSDGQLWLALIEIEHTRFAPWSEWAGAFAVKPERSLKDLTVRVAVDGLGIRQVADDLRMDGRRALALLRRALHRYCLSTGWQAGEHPPDVEAA